MGITTLETGLFIRRRHQEHIEGILPKGPYLTCVSMAGRALLTGYHRHQNTITRRPIFRLSVCLGLAFSQTLEHKTVLLSNHIMTSSLYWSFVLALCHRRIPLTKGQWRGALIFPLMSTGNKLLYKHSRGRIVEMIWPPFDVNLTNP